MGIYLLSLQNEIGYIVNENKINILDKDRIINIVKKHYLKSYV